jgi:hypothetical protein
MSAPSSHSPQPVPVMVGGGNLKSAVFDWFKQSSSIMNVVIGTALLMFAVYADKIPITLRYQLSTVPGRALLLIVLYVVHSFGGWIPALLFSIGIALVWANRPLAIPKEGFQNVKVSPADEHKWFVEKALDESPEGVVEDRVNTRAVQDNSDSGNSRTSK